jgi:phosphoglycolate phosphatase-like HAD superfamily hydrolase
VRLFLFDIDGTLLSCGTQIRPLIARVFAEVLGREVEIHDYAFSGKTDDRIFRELAARSGLPAAAIETALPAVRERYFERLERELDVDGMVLLPGVLAALESLAGQRGVALGLLTGNWERSARTRLSRFDLNRFFPFGAFSEGCLDRDDLPPIALDRAHRALARRFAPEEVVIVGDSLLDVACARAHGVPCLAVATGGTGMEELSTAGAHWVCQNLAAAEALLAELAGR